MLDAGSFMVSESKQRILDTGYWILDTGRSKLVDMSYKKLQIWALAREIVIDVHEMTMKLPKFEMYEEGSQIRRSSKTTKATIVEGYGRRRYKQDWLKFLTYAISSNDETMDHLENLWDTKSLTDESIFMSIKTKIERLGRMLNNFIKTVQEDHESPK
jgi:four helix bundle protein